MLARRYLLLAIVAILLAAGCGHDPASSPVAPADGNPGLLAAGVDAQLAAAEIVAVSGWETDPAVTLPDHVANLDTKCLGQILDWSREVLIGDIVHYEFLVQVGPGEYDRIMLHRVVKERRPLRPIKTRHALFLQHGDAVGFAKFLYGHAAPSVPDDHAVAIYLAQHDVDVWGLDQNWVLVPEETADFGFMQHWGMDNQIDNLGTALAIARHSRRQTGNGFRKMHLLGYSSGAMTGYAYINAEAVIPYGHRHVKGFICADMVFKYAPEDEDRREFICDDVLAIRARLDAGDLVEPIPFVAIGELAASDPDGVSPIFPDFTNLELALFYGGATYQLWPFNFWWHYFGAEVDPETGMPTDFRFTSLDNATDFMRLGCAWETLRFIHDYEVIICDEQDVPWDDNLATVDMPILYLEPAGGIGTTGRHTLTLFGSNDVQISTASLLPPEQVAEDFGHIDLFTAEQAPSLVWQPLLEWVVSHPGRGVDDDEAYLTADTR